MTVFVQGLQDKQDVAEGDMQKGNRELLALKAWGGQIGDLIEAVDEIIKGLDLRAATPGPFYGIDLQEQQLPELTAHFCKVGVGLAFEHNLQDVMAIPAFALKMAFLLNSPNVWFPYNGFQLCLLMALVLSCQNMSLHCICIKLCGMALRSCFR